MKVKMICHLMPWELDYALLTFVKLKKSYEYLSKDIEIIFDCVLNLSDSIIDWKKSRIEKKHFIDKFYSLKNLVSCFNINRYEVIDGDKLYGHLNLQKECISDDVDGYIYMCPDQNFDETLIAYMCKAAKTINDKYFILTSEIYKGWDSSWNPISSDKYKDVSYDDCGQECPYKLEYENFYNDVSVKKISEIKFAGWVDYYSKDFINEFAKIPDDWNGYGPWDFYSMVLSYNFNKLNLKEKIHQYVLTGKIIYPIESKPYPDGFKKYYKDLLEMKNLNQRLDIENKISETIKKRILEINSGNL